MAIIKLDISKTSVALTAEQKARAVESNRMLRTRTGAGNDFLGWVSLPSSTDAAQRASVRTPAERRRSKAEVIVCTGIGGS